MIVYTLLFPIYEVLYRIIYREMLLSFTADVTLHDMSLASYNRNCIAFDSQVADASSLFKKGANRLSLLQNVTPTMADVHSKCSVSS